MIGQGLHRVAVAVEVDQAGGLGDGLDLVEAVDGANERRQERPLGLEHLLDRPVAILGVTMVAGPTLALGLKPAVELLQRSRRCRDQRWSKKAKMWSDKYAPETKLKSRVAMATFSLAGCSNCFCPAGDGVGSQRVLRAKLRPLPTYWSDNRRLSRLTGLTMCKIC